MSFQIKAIALYNSNGDRRELIFELGKVNVITGASKTGKSALIQIVDYCLGRTEFLIPAGKIREHVVWYAIKIKGKPGEAIVARPAPASGFKTNSEAFIATGGTIEFPELSELSKTTNVEALEAFLTEFAGIASNQHIPPLGQSRGPTIANISHTTFLLFQPQNRIADQTTLFYRQEEPFLGQAIKDTLPYFLGAAADDRYELLQKLRRLRRELKLLEQRLEIEQSIATTDDSRAITLLSEAEQFGLVEKDQQTDSHEKLIAALKGVLEWTPTSQVFDTNEAVSQLRGRRDSLAQLIEQLNQEVEAARAFALDQRGFGDEVKEQRNRLESIGLYSTSADDEEPICPLCSSKLEHIPPPASALINSMQRIDEQIDAVVRQRPRLERYIQEREERITSTKQQIEEIRLSLNAIYEQEEQMREQQLLIAKQARIVGRISLFLDSLTKRSETSDLQNRVKQKQSEVKRLEKKAGDTSVEDRMVAILRIIGSQMTTWAKELNLEHSENAIDLDLKNLTVVAYTASGVIPMREMGSGENWVCCHLIALLALHQWFVKESRPVPHFIFFDQPTQVYFPQDLSQVDHSVDELDDEDRLAVRRMFQLIFNVAADLAPGLQIIITDHADLQDEWFQKAVCERWRNGKKLVPESWYLQQ